MRTARVSAGPNPSTPSARVRNRADHDSGGSSTVGTVIEPAVLSISFEELQARFEAADPPRPDDVNTPEVAERVAAHPDGLARELWRVFGYDPDNLPV